MAIARQGIERLGGSFRLENRATGGLVQILRLPLAGTGAAD